MHHFGRGVGRAARGRGGCCIRSRREAVANAVRHSGASRLMISACRGEDTVLVEVIDNGCGLPSKPPLGWDCAAWPTGRMR